MSSQQRRTLYWKCLLGLVSVGGMVVILWLWFNPSLTPREQTYQRNVNAALLYEPQPFRLAAVTPWAWEKLCVLADNEAQNMGVKLEHASPKRWFDKRVVLAFFAPNQAPWGLRISTDTAPPITLGQCVTADYLFPVL